MDRGSMIKFHMGTKALTHTDQYLRKNMQLGQLRCKHATGIGLK